MSGDRDVAAEFGEALNMTAKELERWLSTEESKEVGQKPDGGESTGHASGREIVRLLRKGKSSWTGQDFEHMAKVSDQHSLRRTLGGPAVVTRVCFDSAFSTGLLFGLRRIGVFRAARSPAARRLVAAALSRVHIGSDGFAVRADAVNGERHAALALTGNSQSRVTALVAAYVVRAVVGGALPAGVHHIDQLPPLAGLPEELAGNGVRLHDVL
ncbi:DUF3140 domain-containing protein [Nonomuraea sp. NPDC052265]|uniref:DUF3140 domain-containing protein n=1 Tax=Nonomuraea sp. NPDC052265 TaxID=3364374 RepID=UPI0037C8596D